MGRTDNLENDIGTMHPLISWRSVLAGLLIAFLTMTGLFGLALAFGVINISATGLDGEGIFPGVWFLVSALISIFIGSYFAARVSKFQTGRIGSAQGLVIAAIFLSFIFVRTFSPGMTFLAANSGALRLEDQQVVMNPVLQIVEESIVNLNLRSGLNVAAKGVATRLVRGDKENAGKYLRIESGISPEVANAYIVQMKPTVDKTIDGARSLIEDSVRDTGWALFLLVILSSLSSVLGGALGSVANFRNPLSREQFTAQGYSHA